MKTLLWIVVTGSVIVIALRWHKQQWPFKGAKESSSEKPIKKTSVYEKINDKGVRYSFTPSDLAQFVNDYDKDKIAGVCVNNGFSEFINGSEGQKIYSYYRNNDRLDLAEENAKGNMDENIQFADTVNKIIYVIKNSIAYSYFILSLKNDKLAFLLSEKKNSTFLSRDQYLLNDCLFVDYGYSSVYKGNCIFVYPNKQLQLTELKKHARDSVASTGGMKKLNIITEIYPHRKAYVNISEAFFYDSYKDCGKDFDVMIIGDRSPSYETLSKGTKLEVLKETRYSVYCNIRKNNRTMFKAWVCKKDINYGTPDF